MTPAWRRFVALVWTLLILSSSWPAAEANSPDRSTTSGNEVTTCGGEDSTFSTVPTETLSTVLVAPPESPALATQPERLPVTGGLLLLPASVAFFILGWVLRALGRLLGAGHSRCGAVRRFCVDANPEASAAHLSAHEGT